MSEASLIWLFNGHLLSSHGPRVYAPVGSFAITVSPYLLISSSYRDTRPNGLGPTSFELNYLFKCPISKFNHILCSEQMRATWKGLKEALSTSRTQMIR